MRLCIALPSLIVCALAACDDPASPAATEPASLKGGAAQAQVTATAQLLVTGLQELQGSAVGPGGALFVTAPLTGSIWRVDPTTGAVTLFATGLPPRVPIPEFIGSGVVDVAFIGGTAYALVTGVGPDLGGDDVVGIYRVDGPNSFTVVADIGAFSIAIRRASRSSPRAVTSSRSNRFAADSWSPTGTTTGCCGSPWMARFPK